jgi:hypothetical protein
MVVGGQGVGLKNLSIYIFEYFSWGKKKTNKNLNYRR